MALYARFSHPENGFPGETGCEKLVPNVLYPVADIMMGQSFTYVFLACMPDEPMNSAKFDFFEAEPHDIYGDPKYNPYLKLKEDN